MPDPMDVYSQYLPDLHAPTRPQSSFWNKIKGNCWRIGQTVIAVAGAALLVVTVALPITWMKAGYDAEKEKQEEERKAALTVGKVTGGAPKVTECRNVPSIPSGVDGHFCTVVKAGGDTGIIKPPPQRQVVLSLGAPGTILFYDWKGRVLDPSVTVSGPRDDFQFHPDWTSFRVKLDADGVVTVRMWTHR